jgi:hypothetical protein
MRREDMPLLQRAVSDVLDEYLVRFHGLTTSHTNPDSFLEWLGEGGYTVVPKQTEAEVARLRDHIADIDAHATPYGDLPEDPGYVGTYLLTAGALHRALGTLGHSAPSCTAEADLVGVQRRLGVAQLNIAIQDSAIRRLTAERDALRGLVIQILAMFTESGHTDGRTIKRSQWMSEEALAQWRARAEGDPTPAPVGADASRPPHAPHTPGGSR